MTRQALIAGVCAFMIVACVVMAYASGVHVAAVHGPTVTLVGQIHGIDASVPPRWQGCVCMLDLGGQRHANIVTKDAMIQSILMIGFTSQKNMVVMAEKLPGPPPGAGGWPGGDYYAVEYVATTVGQ